MRKIIAIFLAIVSIFSLSMASELLLTESAMAKNEWTNEACNGADEQQKAALGCDKNDQAPKVVTNILNTVISIVGILAVLILVIAGQRYIVSNGDPGKLQQAKNMVLYGLIGLVVALLSFAIVNFILNGVFS